MAFVFLDSSNQRVDNCISDYINHVLIFAEKEKNIIKLKRMFKSLPHGIPVMQIKIQGSLG